jgi:hypothetical protein
VFAQHEATQCTEDFRVDVRRGQEWTVADGAMEFNRICAHESIHQD